MRRHLKYAMILGFNDELQKLANPLALATSVIPSVLKGVQALGPAVTTAAKEVAATSIVNAAADKLKPPAPNPGM